jgi:hypothetical protein
MKCRGGKMKANTDVDARKITMKKGKRKEKKKEAASPCCLVRRE